MTALLVAACGAPGTTEDAGTGAEVTGCAGPRPADADGCVVGDDFVDCAGIGEPRFGCLASGAGCAWFPGGCVPSTYHASPCPSDDLCCLDDWPFPEGLWSASTGWSLAYVVYGMGSEPVDAGSFAAVDVAIDPAVLPVEPSLACASAWDDLCPPGPSAPLTALAERGDDTLTVRAVYPGFFGRELRIEVLPGAPLRARACARPYTDYRDGASCSPPGDAWICADSGTLVVSELPEPRSAGTVTGVRFEGDFGARGTVTLEL